MRLQIREKGYHEASHIFKVELSFFNDTNRRLVNKEVKLEFPSLHTEIDWKWYFEAYGNGRVLALKDQVEAAQYRTKITQYGENLFQQLLEASHEIYAEYAKLRSDLENLIIEIIGVSAVFHSIYWECLKDKSLSNPLAVMGVRIVRKNDKNTFVEAKAKPAPYINLLVVTARPRQEEDLNYYTIHDPILETIQTAGVKVRPFTLRPATYQALLKHLNEKKPGFYHIIHFDLEGGTFDYAFLQAEQERNKGRLEDFDLTKNNYQVDWKSKNISSFRGEKAFLYFESKRKGLANPIEVAQLAGHLQTFKIPLVLLSAAQIGATSGDASAIGRMLVEKGAQLVLAMRHSISRTATSLFMKRFYEQLFQKKSVEASIVLARQDLFGDKSRLIGADNFELEDWLLPIIHANRDVTFDIRDFETEEEELAYYTAIDQRPYFPHDFNRYQGIDLDLLRIGNLLQAQQHLVLIADDAQQLSLFSQYVMAYWTRFHFVKHALSFSCSEGLTLQTIVEALRERLITDPSELIEFESKPFLLQKNKILEYLRSEKEKCLLVFHDADLLSEKTSNRDLSDIQNFLSQINVSFVIYTATDSSKLQWRKFPSRKNHVYHPFEYKNRKKASLPPPIKTPSTENIPPQIDNSESDSPPPIEIPAPPERTRTVQIFIAYDKTEYKTVVELEKYFERKIEDGSIHIWHHGKIQAGQLRMAEIDKYLNQADIIVYMVSADFLASDYYKQISKIAMQRHKQKISRLIPVIVRFCMWDWEDFASLEVLPDDDHPIYSSANVFRQKAYRKVALRIAAVAKDFS